MMDIGLWTHTKRNSKAVAAALSTLKQRCDKWEIREVSQAEAREVASLVEDSEIDALLKEAQLVAIAFFQGGAEEADREMANLKKISSELGFWLEAR